MVLIAEADKYDVRRGPFSGLTVNAKLYQSDAQRFVVVVDGVPWHKRAVAQSAELGFDSLADGMAALKDFRVRAAELSQGRIAWRGSMQIGQQFTLRTSDRR